MKRLLAVLLSAAALSVSHAQNRPVEDPPVRHERFHVVYSINDDLSSSETRELVVQVLHAKALDWVKTATIEHSASVQQVEVLQAYTRKADGRRIDVPKDNYQVRSSQGRGTDQPAFSDIATTAVVFPDLAVGDATVLSYRILQKEPIFPGHFNAAFTFSRAWAVDDVQLSVDYPAALSVRFAGREVAQSEETLADGRKRVRWTWRNAQATRSGRPDGSVVDSDKEPGAAFSTFENYRAIAAAYGVRALPKSTPTERIKALAQDIAGPHGPARDQARALYEWVSTHITYGGNCVGIGSVVPRDLDWVIDNRMGDCKDHAALLQALLSARGIASDQALINAGMGFRLPAIPQVAAVNHVINYLPDFDLYLDATAKHWPFGTLPISLRGKPVLHVGQWRNDAVTPLPAVARQQSTHSALKLAGDGSLSGTVLVHYQGDAAIDMRTWARSLPKASQPDLVRDALRGMGLQGHGRLELDDATALTADYRIKVHLTRVERFAQRPGPGGFAVVPLVGGSTVAQMARAGTADEVDDDVPCTNGIAIETYTIDLPKGMKITSLPRSIKLESSVQRYEASTVQTGQTLRIQRKFVDHTPVAVCPPAISKAYQQLGSQVQDNLKGQVLYR